MSQLDSGSANAPRGVIVKKPKTNVYTMMLLISLLALILGCIFLYAEFSQYGGFGAG